MIFLDTDVLLDMAWRREPYWMKAADVMSVAVNTGTAVLITPIVLSNLYYLLSKHGSPERAIQFNKRLLEICEFTPHLKDHFSMAYESAFKDKEDAVNYFTVKSANTEYIITRNKRDFAQAELTVYTPEEFLIRAG